MVSRARFTPSMLEADDLEAMFVNREPILRDIVGRIEAAVTVGGLDHTLVVGSRGAGKTHLVSLVYHRARALDGYGERFTVAWLEEDPWLMNSWESLQSAIATARAREDAIGSDGIPNILTVILIENLDRVLDALGAQGRRAFRAALESDPPILLVATSTRMTRPLQEQAEPFYGLFHTVPLKPFNVDEAAIMLRSIADMDGDEALAERIASPVGRARIAAITHLAGGQPRVWAMLAETLEAEGTSEFADVLMEKFDDLTPYYQEQLGQLSVQQRQFVRALADADRALTVRELSEFTGIDQRSASKTLTDLRRSSWVCPRTGPLMDYVDKRLTYYELADPMARLVFPLKASRGAPMRRGLEFVASWFLSEALTAELERPVDRTGLGQLMLWNSGTVEPGVITLSENLDDALAALQRGDARPLLASPVSVVGLTEHRLAGRNAVRAAAAQRLNLAPIAVRAGGEAASWIARIEDAVAGLEGAALTSGLIRQGAVMICAGRVDAGRAVLRAAFARGEGGWAGDSTHDLLAAFRCLGRRESAGAVGLLRELWAVADPQGGGRHPLMNAVSFAPLVGGVDPDLGADLARGAVELALESGVTSWEARSAFKSLAYANNLRGRPDEAVRALDRYEHLLRKSAEAP